MSDPHERPRPLPNEAPDRCALAAQLRGDPMPGSAPPHARLLLVEQPGPWGPRGLVESRADPALAHRVDELAAAGGMRLQGIRSPDARADADGHRVALADVRRGVGTVWWWTVPDLTALIAQLESATPADNTWRPDDAEADTDPLFLVCTHGRHDACCALRGRPLAAALQRHAPGRVWETTHVGGDRFAANLLVLPTGEMYGRVGAGEATGLLELVRRGELATGHLRGWLGLAPVAQAALVHAHEHLGVTAGGRLHVQQVRRIDDDRVEVTVHGPDGPALVVLMEIAWTGPNRLTCRGPAQARARVYRALSARPAATHP